jgi:hypothetical protein
VNGLPAIVIVPVRELDVVFWATVNATLAAPLPLAPEVIEIHDAPLVAVHAQPAGDVRAMLPLPPFALKLCDVGEIELLHPPACVTVIHWPASRSEPVRLFAPVLGSAAKVAVPGPLPVLVVEIQREADTAVQLHPVPVSTSIDPLPPEAGTLTDNGDRA